MRTKRNQRTAQKTGISIAHGMRKTFIAHVKKNGVLYAPALAPIAVFFLAHIVFLLAFVLMKIGVLQNGQLVHKTIVTWAVFGFPSLLLSSYLCFYVVTRFAVGGMLVRKFPLWSATMLNLAIGTVYGAGIGIFLVLLRKPEAWFSSLLLLCIGIVAGQGNWLFYRKLAGGDA
jgi:hypothetical protein